MSSKKSEFTDRLKIVMGGISQREFAKRLEISPSTLWEYLNGRVPPIDFVARICERFKVSADWLLTGEEPTARSPDIITEKILQLLDGMDEDKRRDVLRHAEEKKLLADLMKERKQEGGAA